MSGIPYNNKDPNANFFNHFVETFQNQNQNKNVAVEVTDSEFKVGNNYLNQNMPIMVVD